MAKGYLVPGVAGTVRKAIYGQGPVELTELCGPLDYPFVVMPKLHMCCLICGTIFPILDGVNLTKWQCPHCRAVKPKSQSQRLSLVLGE